MLAVALVLVHAAPAFACASSGTATGCCGDCDPNTCHLVLTATCVDSQATCSVGVTRMHAPAADASGNGYGPDHVDVNSPVVALSVANATPCSTSLAPPFGSAPRLYLLLRQLRL
jgi:hypothetical protein